jgi:16S rRNA (adenine1518-N6/adenine1519-N6)-dimethyltransferase
MDPSLDLPPLQIGALLRAHQLHPKKGLGQNFLADPIALQRIVTSAEIEPEAHVLEVGPGLGSLTRYLARVAKQVVAVEIDQNLLPVLQEVLSPFDNVRIVHGDILELNPAELMPESGYQVVANIPYYITSAVIRHLLEAPVKPSRIVLTVQREVAERISAGTGKLSLLALSVQVYGQPRTVARIPAGAFYPSPKVDSAVVRVDLYPEPLIPAEQLNSFFRLAKAGFSQKRKMLRNSLVGGLSMAQERVEALLQAADIDPQRRAETLSIEEWRILTEKFVSVI